ncbi:MAG: acyl-CoA synthetase [Gammaproteobacteria bacterium]|nr:acyl-CoA synthetase [Gammaproteobacteria bacterium]
MISTHSKEHAKPADRQDLRKRFIKRFASDPDVIQNSADIAQLELIDTDQRFPCHSPSEALALASDAFPKDVAISYLPTGSATDKPIHWSYREYQQEVNRAANLFHSLGLKSDQSVVLMLPNVPQCLFGLWGAQIAGIAAPINPYLEVEHIASIAQSANAKILVTLAPEEPGGAALYEKAVKTQAITTQIEHIIVVGHSRQENCLMWDQETKKQPADTLIFKRSISGLEIASYFHTGGTTGAPKLAQHTHRKQIINVCQMQLTGPRGNGNNEYVDRDVILCTLPLFHVNAAFVTSLNAILGAGHVIIAGPNGFRNQQLIHDFWRLIEQYKVTFFAAVPTIYATLLEQPIGDVDTSSLLNCGCGAAPMPVSLLDRFAQTTGADIMEGYGMTETIAAATTHYFFGDRKIGSVGLRLPYQNIKIAKVDDTGQITSDCALNEVGIIFHNGASTFPGYKQVEANIGAWSDGEWFNSGDMGRIDKDGYLWLVGRSKDLIIRGGHNIDPLITEDALASHPAVEIAAAVGRPDTHAGEVPVAYVQLLDGASVTEEALKNFAREHVSERAAAPVEVIICDALPVTAVGKIFKPTLRKKAIASAFNNALLAHCPDIKFAINVVDDKRLGTRVTLRCLNHTPSEDLHLNVNQALQDFAQSWELQ